MNDNYTQMPRFTALLRLLPHAGAADQHAFAEQILADWDGEKRWPRPADVLTAVAFFDDAQRTRLLAIAPALTKNWYAEPRTRLYAELGVEDVDNSASGSEETTQ